MKNSGVFSYILYPISFILLFSGCAKVETTRVNTVTNTTTQTTIAGDEVTVNNEFDNAVDDAIAVICNHKATILNTYIDTSRINLGVIEIDYDNSDNGKEADGTKERINAQDSIHLPMIGNRVVAWGTPGATPATVSFGDINLPEYEVNFITNNTSLRLVGGATLINMNGGSLQNLSGGDSLQVHIKADFAFTYNDQTTGAQTFTWYINQLRTFTMSDTNMLATSRGDTVMNGSSGVGTWGTTRLGNSFYTVITAPVVQNISSPYLSYNPLSGAKEIDEIQDPIACLFGVNSQGFAVSDKPYGFYIGWVNNGVQATEILPYYY